MKTPQPKHEGSFSKLNESSELKFMAAIWTNLDHESFGLIVTQICLRRGLGLTTEYRPTFLAVRIKMACWLASHRRAVEPMNHISLLAF